MKQTYAIYAGLVAIGLACAEPATAQLLAYPPVGNMPPQEVVALVRSAKFEPVSRPVRVGPAYVLHAVTPAGREVRVVVDARLRQIVRVVAIGPARPAVEAAVPPLPAPYGRPPAGIAAVPDGNGPSARVTGLPPDVDGAEPYGPSGQQTYGQVAGVGTMPAGTMPAGTAPAAPSRTPAVSAAPTTSQASPPPLPRPRPKLAAAEPAAPGPPATGNTVAPPSPVRTNGIGASATAVPPHAAISLHEPTYEEHE